MRIQNLIIAVAAVLLTSCAQDGILSVREKVNEPEQPINFSIYTDMATKAFPANAESLTSYHDQFVVFSTKTSTIDGTVLSVFNGDTVYSKAGSWEYKDLRYWDKQANFSFVAISPSAKYIIYNKTDNVADASGDYVTVAGGYTLVGTNLQDGTRTTEVNKGFTGENGKDADLMTAQKNNQNGATHDATVDMLFNHILAKLNVTIGKAKILDTMNVYIKKVEVLGLDNHGTYAQKDYNVTNSGWNSTKEDANYKLSWEAENIDGVLLNSGTTNGLTYTPGAPKYFIESLVMPQSIERDVEALRLEYAINDQDYKYQLKFKYNDTLKDMNQQDSVVLRAVFPEFMDRNKYILKLTIDPEAIIFDARAAAWAEQIDTTLIVK
jgi:hypothetical protein